MIEDNIEQGDNAQSLMEEDKLQLNTLYGQARLGFIQKVFTILGFQVICTVGAVLLMIYSQTFFLFQQSSTFLFIVAVVAWLLGYVFLVHQRMNRQYPRNVILLWMYTIGQSYCVSYLCGAYLVSDFKNILFIAAMMTLGIVFGCVAYAYKTKNDFTTNEGAKIIGIISVLMLIVFVVFQNENLLTILVCSLATALYGMHLIINIQVMIGSNQKMLSIDDYMICAIELYTNILQLFACVLMILTAKRNR